MRIAIWTAVCVVMSLAWASPSSSAPPGWPAALTIGTASPGGVYLLYGQALAPILTESLGLPVTAQSTQGPDQNILLIESGAAELGFVTMGVALQAWNGTGTWTQGQKLRSMRALFPMYDTPFQFLVRKDSAIRDIRDMGGKRIGAGPQGGTGGTYLPLVFEALQVPAVVRNGAWDLMGKQIGEHLLDGVMASAGAPVPALANLEKTEPVAFVALSDDEIAAIHKVLPEMTESVVPAGTYTSMKADYKTIGLYNFAVASKSLPDDLVYSIVKAFYANHDRMVAAHPSARDSVVANLNRNQFLPFHPGAVRYYREIGVEIPDALAKSTAQ